MREACDHWLATQVADVGNKARHLRWICGVWRDDTMLGALTPEMIHGLPARLTQPLLTRRPIALLLTAVACAEPQVPQDPYQRALYENDRQRALCITYTVAAGRLACEQRVAGERQRIVAEEMSRREGEATREQTAELKAAIEAQRSEPAPALPPPSPPQWCILIVDGAKATEGCYPTRAECNTAWSDFRSAGKSTTDCAEKTPTPPTPAPAPAVAEGPREWCTTVDVEGGTKAASCYPDRDGCEAARDFHVGAGTKATPCAEPSP